MSDDEVVAEVMKELRRQLDGGDVEMGGAAATATELAIVRGLFKPLAIAMVRELGNRRLAQLMARRAMLLAKVKSLPRPPLH